jgi:hypothetical protein
MTRAVLASFVLLTGCYHAVGEPVRFVDADGDAVVAAGRAATDLECDASSMTIVRQSGGHAAEPARFVVRGCGASATYVCRSGWSTYVCLRDGAITREAEP